MELKEALGRIYEKAKEKFAIKSTPKLKLIDNVENSKSLFGKTAHYNPVNEEITLYTTNRHPKDICRSFAHEVIHHVQKERGDIEPTTSLGPNYAQEDGHMRKMEMEAYLKGNMLFRDWENTVQKR
tara:strand:+ start:129 stop:506 length:378 start_codon:yes stop_codon:yes gene_type:complete